jgi:hypothetical protein
MSLDGTLEEHRIAGVSLRNGMHTAMHEGMHARVRLVTSAFSNQRCCALGRWIYEDGARWDDVPELLQLELAHASFHTVALVIRRSGGDARAGRAVRKRGAYARSRGVAF